MLLLQLIIIVSILSTNSSNSGELDIHEESHVNPNVSKAGVSFLNIFYNNSIINPISIVDKVFIYNIQSIVDIINIEVIIRVNGFSIITHNNLYYKMIGELYIITNNEIRKIEYEDMLTGLINIPIYQGRNIISAIYVTKDDYSIDNIVVNLNVDNMPNIYSNEILLNIEKNTNQTWYEYPLVDRDFNKYNYEPPVFDFNLTQKCDLPENLILLNHLIYNEEIVCENNLTLNYSDGGTFDHQLGNNSRNSSSSNVFLIDALGMRKLDNSINLIEGYNRISILILHPFGYWIKINSSNIIDHENLFDVNDKNLGFNGSIDYISNILTRNVYFEYVNVIEVNTYSLNVVIIHISITLFIIVKMNNKRRNLNY